MPDVAIGCGQSCEIPENTMEGILAHISKCGEGGDIDIEELRQYLIKVGICAKGCKQNFTIFIAHSCVWRPRSG